MTRPVGYVVTRYPAVSHTFVLREVLALRRAGTSVVTYSVHRARASDCLAEEDRREAATTRSLRPVPPATLAWSIAQLAATHPVAFAGALRSGVSRGRGPRGKLWQFFYFLEAILLRRRCMDDGVRHLHSHFANNAADVARTTVDLGNRIEGRRAWSWSFTMHGPTEFEQPRRFGLAGKISDAGFVACISDFCMEQVRSTAPDALTPLLLVRCGLDLHHFSFVDRAGRSGPARVLCVGRLVHEKGQDVLLESVSRLVARGLELEVLLVGDGPTRSSLAEQVRRLGLREVVAFTGAVGQDSMRDLYAWADVFALLSRAEGLPVVLMEAMATGLPVVTTRIAGIPELVEDGVAGSVVPRDDVDQATNALADVLSDRAAALEAGRRAREAVVAKHDADVCVLPLQREFRRRAAG